jgi:hypothetical protein
MAENSTIYVQGIEVEKVSSFHYLGRILTASGNDELTIQYNLNKARRTWRKISPIL